MNIYNYFSYLSYLLSYLKSLKGRDHYFWCKYQYRFAINTWWWCHTTKPNQLKYIKSSVQCSLKREKCKYKYTLFLFFSFLLPVIIALLEIMNISSRKRFHKRWKEEHYTVCSIWLTLVLSLNNGLEMEVLSLHLSLLKKKYGNLYPCAGAMVISSLPMLARVLPKQAPHFISLLQLWTQSK